MKEYGYHLKNISCANCADKIESKGNRRGC
ncbi:copper chaperone CopZ [Acholeplasma morum]|nr:copper chaperone CopZ [Paracholeplasma morum]